MIDQVNKLKIGQIVWWRGVNRGKIISVDKVENQYATVLLGFQVRWDDDKTPLKYESTDIKDNAVHLEQRKG